MVAMDVYPLYRLNRSVALVIMVTVAIIGALMAPITLTLKTGATASMASAVVSSSAQQADPAARAIASQQHVTLTEAGTRLSWQQAVPTNPILRA